MKRSFGSLCFLFGLVCSLCGCSAGEKSVGQNAVYFFACCFSLILLAGYMISIRQKNRWMVALFTSISLANAGYAWLSMASTLESALNANRLAYLGSVFLPMLMFMIVTTVSGIRLPRAAVWGLLGVGLVMFAVTATPGILPIYYKDVSLEIVNGVSSLNKVYGPLHGLYMVYLLGYFAAIIAAIVRSIRRRKPDSVMHGVFLAVAVFVNIGVWLIEQLVKVDFEMLSVSYLISELFLLGLSLMIQENDKRLDALRRQLDAAVAPPSSPTVAFTDEDMEQFQKGLALLTATERTVFDLYVSGHSSKQILEILDIKENTLKYHNRNIYSKLGVSSRKQMLALAAEVTA